MTHRHKRRLKQILIAALFGLNVYWLFQWIWGVDGNRPRIREGQRDADTGAG